MLSFSSSLSVAPAVRAHEVIDDLAMSSHAVTTAYCNGVLLLLWVHQLFQHAATFLIGNSPNKGSPKEMLKEMAIEFPEVLQDPVYVTALKNFHMDVASIERERRIRQQQAVRAAVAAAAASRAAVANAAAQMKSPAAASAASTAKAPVSSNK